MTPDHLPRDIAPPPTLEDRTVGALQSHRLLKPSRQAILSWTRVAAAIVVFAAGMAAGVAWSRPAPVAPGKARYLLLLDGATTASAMNEARTVEDYRNWAIDLRREGRFVAGERLAPAAAVVPDGAPAASGDLQGYFVVSADHLTDAVSIARTSPHAMRGGRVVVRPIDTPQ